MWINKLNENLNLGVMLNRTFIDKVSPSFISLVTRAQELLDKLKLNDNGTIIYLERKANGKSVLCIHFRYVEGEAVFSSDAENADPKLDILKGEDMIKFTRKLIEPVVRALDGIIEESDYSTGVRTIYMADFVSKKIMIKNDPTEDFMTIIGLDEMCSKKKRK